MKITVHMAVEADELFESLIKSVLYDIEQATGKHLPVDRLKKGYSYKKVLKAKAGGDRHVTTKITHLERPYRYAASFKSQEGVNTIDYQIEPCEGGGIDVHYEEAFSSQKALTDLNGKLTGAIYSWSAKRQMKKRFKQMEAFIKQERDKEE